MRTKNHILPASARAARRLLAAVFVAAAPIAIAYTAWTGFRAARLYAGIKSDGRSWDVPIHRFHPMLGYEAIPGANSVERYPNGYAVPVHFNADGFRIPAEPDIIQDGSSPHLLALGCSFTFGMACKAEDAFPYRVAARLHGTALNAALGGYGLVHMVLRARELIPKFAPDWVLIEYAPWLVERSLAPISNAMVQIPVPGPYLAVQRDGRFGIEPPPFAANYFALPVRDYARGPAGIRDFASFFVHAALPLYLWSDPRIARYRLGSHCPAAPDSESLVQTFYNEIADLAQRCRGRVCIVILGPGGLLPGQLPPHHLRALRAVPGAVVADAHRALYERLSVPTPEAYDKAYAIWHGEPPKLIDRHPNPAAHALIADAILDAMETPAPQKVP